MRTCAIYAGDNFFKSTSSDSTPVLEICGRHFPLRKMHDCHKRLHSFCLTNISNCETRCFSVETIREFKICDHL